MAIELRQKATLEEFEAFITRPENLDKRFEYISGEIVEVPSNGYVSIIAAQIIILIGMFLKQSNLPGYVTGEGGSFIVDGHVLAPDVAYMLQLPGKKGFDAIPLLLAVEVIFDPQSHSEQADLRRKMIHYMRANVPVWIVDYMAREIKVHVASEDVKIFGEDSIVPGGDVLPGFELPVKDIFPDEKES